MTRRAAVISSLAAKIGLEALAALELQLVRERTVPERLLRRLTQPDELSKREREVLVLLASGFTNRQIADELGIGYETVRFHRQMLYRRYGTHNVVETINAFLEEDA